MGWRSLRRTLYPTTVNDLLFVRRRLNSLVERIIMLTGAPALGGRVPNSRPLRLIFVCTGNICRSPYCEYKSRGMGFQAISCGTDTTSGLMAEPLAIEEAGRRGIDLTQHRTTSWQSIQLHEGDLVVALTLRHLWAIRRRAAQAGCPIILMSALRRDDFEVLEDPYGKDRSEFVHCFNLIDEAIGNLAKQCK